MVFGRMKSNPISEHSTRTKPAKNSFLVDCSNGVPCRTGGIWRQVRSCIPYSNLPEGEPHRT